MSCKFSSSVSPDPKSVVWGKLIEACEAIGIVFETEFLEGPTAERFSSSLPLALQQLLVESHFSVRFKRKTWYAAEFGNHGSCMIVLRAL